MQTDPLFALGAALAQDATTAVIYVDANGFSSATKVQAHCSPGRAQHCLTIIDGTPNVGFFEVHAENYMCTGGPPHRRSARGDAAPAATRRITPARRWATSATPATQEQARGSDRARTVDRARRAAEPPASRRPATTRRRRRS